MFSEKSNFEPTPERNLEEIRVVLGGVEDLENLPENPEIEDSENMERVDEENEIILCPVKFNYENLKSEIEKGKASLLLAKEGEGIVGFICFSKGEEVFIRLMWVSPEKRGKGVADKLIQNALNRAEGKKVSLDLWGKERGKKFFGKYGFKENPGGGHTNRLTREREDL